MSSKHARSYSASALGLFFLTISLSAFAAPSAPLYIDDVSGLLGTVDLSTGAVTVLGNTGLGGNLTDIGFQNGTLYGTTYTGFYALNSTNGAATTIASYNGVGGGGMNALVGSTGTSLYAASGSANSLYSVAINGATSTLSGTTGAPSAGDLASANGFLYESAIGSNGNDELLKLTISGNNVSGTVVGYFNDTGSELSGVFGLATGDDGVTYAVNGTRIYSVDLANANLTLVDDYSGKGLGDANGTAFTSESPPNPPVPPTPPVPEPASLVLFGTGLLGLSLIRRHRNG